MSFLGGWQLNDILTFYLQTINPDTGDALDADSTPLYRIYAATTGTPIVTGTYAPMDAANTNGFYTAQVSLTYLGGFRSDTEYVVRTDMIILGALEASEDTFTIGSQVIGISPAKFVWRAQALPRSNAIIAVSPARVQWRAQRTGDRTITITPARLRWKPGTPTQTKGEILIIPTRLAWKAQGERVSQSFPFREYTLALGRV